MKLALPESCYQRRPRWNKETRRMALLLKGGEFIATEALSASTISGLLGLARRQPLVINGLELHHEDLVKLAEEVRLTGQPVWPKPSDKLQSVDSFASSIGQVDSTN
jgi:hypothetical protein